jgi:hypothetical protein
MLNLFLEMILTRLYQIILEIRYFRDKKNFSVIIAIAIILSSSFSFQELWIYSKPVLCIFKLESLFLPTAAITIRDNEIRGKVKLLSLDK